jgi:hypothetical protein
MVFTFLKAQGHEVGNSLLEEDQLETCREYLRRAEESGVQILLPTDIRVADEFPRDNGTTSTVVPADQIPADKIGLDIGPESARRFAALPTHGGVLERVMGVFSSNSSPATRDVARPDESTGCRSSAGDSRRRTQAATSRIRAHLHRWRRPGYLEGRPSPASTSCPDTPSRHPL